MTMLDDVRDVIGAFLRYRGHSINSVDPGELAGAKRDAIAAKANLKAYLSAPVKGAADRGDVWLAQLWNGDAAQARKEQPALRGCCPRRAAPSGSTRWWSRRRRRIPAPRTSSSTTPCVPRSRAAISDRHRVRQPEPGRDAADSQSGSLSGPQTSSPGSRSRKISAGRVSCGIAFGPRSKPA